MCVLSLSEKLEHRRMMIKSSQLCQCGVGYDVRSVVLCHLLMKVKCL